MKSLADNFFAWLTTRALSAGSLLCVGLDPRAGSADDAREECLRLIEATAPFACAFKANSAFFEAHGSAGIDALREVIAAVPEGIPVLLDAKRGDIGETSTAYAAAAFDALGAHAITVSPYLGGDAIAPFLARPERGAFVLSKTSNPGAGEFQSLEVGGRPLYELVAERAQTWNANGNVGLVVGATDVEALARVRAIAPDLWFLVPGVGAQGGDLEAALAAGLRPDGLGLLINVSRSIAQAADPAVVAARLRDAIRQVSSLTFGPQAKGLGESQVSRGDDKLERHHPGRVEINYQLPITDYSLRDLAGLLLTSGCVRFGQFTLRSGSLSPIYLDLRRLIAHPEALRTAAKAYARLLDGLAYDRLAAIPYAGLPIATALSLEVNRPMIYARREAKEYGTKAAIEGDFSQGETAVVIDDLATTGGTKIEAIHKLEDAGLIVRDIAVLIDREQGAREMLAADGYELHAVVTLRQLLEAWRRGGMIVDEQYYEVLSYLESNP
jgi:uridine monophosphate synthetase